MEERSERLQGEIDIQKEAQIQEDKDQAEAQNVLSKIQEFSLPSETPGLIQNPEPAQTNTSDERPIITLEPVPNNPGPYTSKPLQIWLERQEKRSLKKAA